jgi:signal peptidase I
MKQGKPIYLPVWQFILFSVLSLGTYTIYWYYRTWKYLRDSTKETLSPGWRTFGMTVPVMNLFVGFRFFRQIDQLSKLKLSPAFLAALLGLAPFIGYWIPLAGLLAFVPLCLAQSALNRSEGLTKMEWRRGEVIACTLLTIIFCPVTVFAIVFGTRMYVISPFQMEGNSMSDTLHDKDYMLVSKWAYVAGNPQRGDIVVFRPPSDSQRYYLKRVIGMPKETLIIRDGYVYIQHGTNEVKLEEPYLNARNQGQTFRHPPSSGDTSEVRYEIPDGQYFVIGDNRQGSLDSRSFQDPNGEAVPYVARDAIIGRVSFVLLPTTDTKVVSTPAYQNLQ